MTKEELTRIAAAGARSRAAQKAGKAAKEAADARERMNPTEAIHSNPFYGTVRSPKPRGC